MTRQSSAEGWGRGEVPTRLPGTHSGSVIYTSEHPRLAWRQEIKESHCIFKEGEASCGPISDLAGKCQQAHRSERPQERGTPESHTARTSLAWALPPSWGIGTALPGSSAR